MSAMPAPRKRHAAPKSPAQQPAPDPARVHCASESPQLFLDEQCGLWRGDTAAFFSGLPTDPVFDLVVTSPPYNIGKSYETKRGLDDYLSSMAAIIDLIVPRLKDTGSICWQVGNYVTDGEIVPLDIEFAPIFKRHNLQLRNRIIWHFGHGLHTRRRFSGRYEVVLWYTKSGRYKFNLDAVRVPSKYPGKKHFKGPRKGMVSGNPLGKNPEDVWTIPNVKSNHPEKTSHPCQFPVGLIERLVLALTDQDDLVFDPFAGVASAGVAALLHNRCFWGCELQSRYINEGMTRLKDTLAGCVRYRPHTQPLYDHTKSTLSRPVAT
jgi:adenine-specific DNA-methyltransferase